LSSDHMPLIIKLSTSAQKLSRKTHIRPQNANIPRFQAAVNQLVNLNMILSSPEEIDDATELFVRKIHIAADSSTCRQGSMNPSDPHYTLLKPEVRDLVRSKR
ncbi:hypothetical protein KR032_012204, partial [Drosophila birchii]